MNPFDETESENIFDVQKVLIPGFGGTRAVGGNRRNRVICEVACCRDVIVIGTIDNHLTVSDGMHLMKVPNVNL
jgi:hypothetical protein